MGTSTLQRDTSRCSLEAIGLHEVDETVGAGVVVGDRLVVLQIVEDDLRQLLAQLNAPLIVGVDVPDDSLHEDLVLIRSDQRAQG